MSREELQDMIELIPDCDFDKIHRFLVELIPESELKPEIQELVEKELRDMKENGGVRHEDIHWK